MDDFYKEAIKTLEIIVKAINGNNGFQRKWRHDAHSCRKKTVSFNRSKFLFTHRKVLPCNRLGQIKHYKELIT